MKTPKVLLHPSLARRRVTAKMVVSSCSKGEMNIISTCQAMKLAVGSYRISMAS